MLPDVGTKARRHDGSDSVFIPAHGDVVSVGANMAVEQDQQVQQIEQAIAEGDRPQALALLEELAKSTYNDHAMTCFRARGLMDIGRFDRAAAAARQAIDLNESAIEGWLWLARACRASRRLNQAQHALERARQVTGDSSQAFAEYALFFAQERAPNVAHPVVEEATQRAPTEAATWAAVGYLHQRMARPADAEQAAKNALAIDPRHADARALMASALTAQSRDASEYAPRVQKRDVLAPHMKQVAAAHTKQRLARSMLEREDGANMPLNLRSLPRLVQWQRWLVVVGPAIVLCLLGYWLASWQQEPFYFVPTLAVLGWSIYHVIFGGDDE